MIDTDLTEHFLVQEHIKLSCSKRCKLSQHDVLRDTPTVIQLSRSSRIHEDFDGLFKRCTHKGSGVGAVDSVTRYRHKMSATRHHISQECHVSIVDGRPIELNDSTQLLQQCSTCCLNTKHLQNFDERVGINSDRIDIFDSHGFRKIDTVGFELPLISDSKAAVFFLIRASAF